MRYSNSFVSIIGVLFCLSLSACVGAKKVDGSEDKVSSSESSVQKPSVPRESDILSEYSFLEISSAANLLTVIFDQSLDKATGETLPTSSPLLECGISGERARDMLMPLKALMDIQIASEREAYIADPESYSEERGFDSCGRNCQCGSLLSVLEGVFLSSLKTNKNKASHQKILTRLEAKASREQDHERLACARRQEWFCSSRLRTYLEKQAEDVSASP